MSKVAINIIKANNEIKNVMTAFITLSDLMNDGPILKRRKEVRELKYLGMLRQGENK